LAAVGVWADSGAVTPAKVTTAAATAKSLAFGIRSSSGIISSNRAVQPGDRPRPYGEYFADAELDQ
jgi:hypothetical protein